jgi:hypothetical protein
MKPCAKCDTCGGLLSQERIDNGDCRCMWCEADDELMEGNADAHG